MATHPSPPARFHATFCMLCYGALTIVVGCGPAEVPRVFADVNGAITFKHEPLTSGTVIFQPSGGAPVTAQISEDGTYLLKGVVGPNTVIIICREPAEEIDPANPPEVPPRPPKSLIPEQYGTPNSPLKFEVEAGANEANFDLEDLPSQLPPA